MRGVFSIWWELFVSLNVGFFVTVQLNYFKEQSCRENTCLFLSSFTAMSWNSSPINLSIKLPVVPPVGYTSLSRPGQPKTPHQHVTSFSGLHSNMQINRISSISTKAPRHSIPHDYSTTAFSRSHCLDQNDTILCPGQAFSTPTTCQRRRGVLYK